MVYIFRRWFIGLITLTLCGCIGERPVSFYDFYPQGNIDALPLENKKDFLYFIKIAENNKTCAYVIPEIFNSKHMEISQKINIIALFSSYYILRLINEPKIICNF